MDSKSTTTATTTTNKLRILIFPYFATSHIQPFTELAVRLAGANDVVEETVAVTPANVSIVQSLLLDCGQHNVKIATYPFPRVDGIPKGVENFAKASPEDMFRMVVVAVSEALTRPAQEALVREESPDVIITEMFFTWNGRLANELGVSCVTFSVMGAFSMLALRHLAGDVGNDDAVREVPGFPAPPIRIPRCELPECLRIHPSSSLCFMALVLRAIPDREASHKRLWPDGAGVRSMRSEENEVVPARDVARALTEFMRPGGPRDAAKINVMELSAKLHAVLAQGVSSHRDLHRLIDDLMAAAAAANRRA